MLWISFPAGHNSLHLPVGLSNYEGSSLPYDPTSLTDLRFVDFFSFLLSVRMKKTLLASYMLDQKRHSKIEFKKIQSQGAASLYYHNKLSNQH